MAEKPADQFVTHEVFNQSKPLADYNTFSTNLALMEAVERYGGDWAHAQLVEFGRLLGSAEYLKLAEMANKHTPILHSFDRFGNRLDEVEFHPAYHQVLEMAVREGIHSSPWAEPKPGGHVARAAACYLQSQMEPGIQCPISMTYGAVPAVSRRSEIAKIWLPKIFSRQYDQHFLPIGQKSGALLGMGMTEKQGGSDVRLNTTRAVACPNSTGEYQITGHKWFFSAPMCDAFLVLAQAAAGLSCFFMPRWLADGSKNAINIQRLKEKLGNRSNASSEVEFHNASGWLLGEEGRGVPTIIEMATYTRLDCALGSAALMQLAVAQAINHSRYRTAFGRKLIEHPLMENVLADLVLEVEAATALSMRVACAFDAQDDEAETHFRRVVTPAAKYWICKRGPTLSAEAMEVLGGNGYVEEGPMARIYRETPLNSIWEGSGNVMCLDMLRALGKTEEALDAVHEEWRCIKGTESRLDRYAAALESDLIQARSEEFEPQARRLAERLALCISASLLIKHAPPAVADAFCSSRLERDWGSNFGTLNQTAHLKEIIERGSPTDQPDFKRDHAGGDKRPTPSLV